MRKCIAILGAETEKAADLAERLAAQPCRLLLMSPDTRGLTSPEGRSDGVQPVADVVGMICPVDSSWEADIIFIAAGADRERELIASIRDFVIQKIVVSVSDDKEDPNPPAVLQQMLPYSKVLKLVLPLSGRAGHCFVSGSDTEALDEAESLLNDTGFRVLTCLNVN